VDELVAFLRGCLDEDERVARAGGEAMDADNPSWPDYATYDGPDIDAAVAYLKQFRPARVLREVESKRRIIDGVHFIAHCAGCNSGPEYRGTTYECDLDSAGLHVLRCLALPYSDRPGYREEWRP